MLLQRKSRAVSLASRCIAAALILFIPAIHAAHAQSPPASDADVSVGAQYDSTHVYVAPADLDTFVKSFAATFGGHPTNPIVTNVLPVPSSEQFQFLLTPVGTLSVFAFQTPIPFPFGQERTGYLVTNMDQAIRAARSAGAEVLVEPFKDPIGMDAVIQWPGGVKMQLYWHFTAPQYPSLQTIPDNRVYVSSDEADRFINSFIRFAHGKISEDNKHADAAEIGRPEEFYRRIRITSRFGKMQVLVTDGHLPYPFGHEVMGYEVQDLNGTLEKAKSVGAKIVFAPYRLSDRITSIVEFPGGYIAEVHSPTKP